MKVSENKRCIIDEGYVWNEQEYHLYQVNGFGSNENNIIAACWRQGHIAVVDTETFDLKPYIDVPAKIPAGCGLAGKNMALLAIVTKAGLTFIHKTGNYGRKPYLFG